MAGNNNALRIEARIEDVMELRVNGPELVESTADLDRTSTAQRTVSEFGAIAAPVPGLAFANSGVLRSVAEVEDPLGGTKIAPDTLSLLQSRSGRGIPLPGDTARSMGAALDVDLSKVRVHVDEQADHIARSLQAKAFTSGSDVYFTSGTYSPTTSAGQRLLAHELAHVAQGASGSTGQPGTVGRADDQAERDADATADQVLRTLRRQAAFVRS